MHNQEKVSSIEYVKRNIHERAAASSSRKAATGALLDNSMSESSFCIHSSKAFLLSSRSTLLEFILEKACFGGAGGIPFLGNSCLSCSTGES
jgi:hypothetical protein